MCMGDWKGRGGGGGADLLHAVCVGIGMCGGGGERKGMSG